MSTDSQASESSVPARKCTIEELEQKIYERWRWDILFWGRFFFPHHFRMDTPEFHRHLLRLAFSQRFLSVAAPRESAKSTVLIFLYPFHGIIFRRFHFIVLVSNTFKKAAMHLDSIKKELADNKMLRETFPGLSITRDAEGDSEFRHSDGFTTKFLCRGVDQIGGIRGIKFGAYRPDLILCDDLEDDELVKNPVRRRDLQNEYDEALIPAGDKKTVQILNVGTILHDDAQMAKLVSKDHYPNFHKIIYRAHMWPDTEKEASLWPEKWSLEDLKKLRREKPNVYAKEMQNNPVAGMNTRFCREQFRYWELREGKAVLFDVNGKPQIAYGMAECRAAISCDLAWTEKRTSDASVIMPGLLTPNSEILVCPYISKKGMRPDETAEHLFLLVERYEKMTKSTVPVGFEKAMLETVTQWILKREMKRRNKFLVTKQLVWDADKNSRVETRLQPRYAQSSIFHMQGMGELEFQLERFPFGAHDDEVDCLQGLVQLLQIPKKVKAEEGGDDIFERLRKMTIEQKYGKPGRKKSGSWTANRIQAVKCPW